MRRVLLASAAALLALSASVSAQSTIPPGSIGSPCVTASQCTVTYPGLSVTCTAGFCGFENSIPAGTIGSTCTATSQCTGTYLGSALYCLSNVCVPVTSGSPGNLGSQCSSNSQCTGTYLGYSLMCLSGVCTVNAGGLTGGAASGGGGNTDPTCTTTADCTSTQQCLYGFCIDYVAPSLNCMVNGKSLCSGLETCSFGVCLPQMPVVACPSPCNPANGEECSSATGTCVVTSSASCGSGCVGGQCLSSPFPGMGSEPVCQMGTAQCSNDLPMHCGSGYTCVWGYCTPCGQLCGISRDLLSTLFAAGGANGGLSSYVLQQVSANITSAIVNGIFQASAGALVQFDASANQPFVLNFAATAAGAAAKAAAQITAGVQLALQSVFAGTAGAQLLLGAGAGLVSGLNVSSGGSLTLSLGSASATVGGRTVANFSGAGGLNVQGLLNIVGDASTFVTFPSVAPPAGSSNAGTVQVSGGVNIQGNVGDLKINIAGSVAGDEAFLASIGAATTLVTSGAISGVAGRARLVVEGTLLMAGQVFEAALELRGAAGSATFQTSASGAATFAGNVTFEGMNIGGNNVLTINASASGSLTADGSNVYFKTFNNCPYSATLRLQVAGSAADAIARGNLTLFNYDVRSYANVANFQCNILICGSASGDCISVQNPNVHVHNGGRRRLLATTTSSTGQASFGPTKVTVSNGKSASGTPSAATSTAAASFHVAALVIAAIIALLSM